MKITRENYEEYFIDYLEGNLDENLVDEFIEFIQKNPDLEAEIKAFKTFSIEGGKVTFPGKNKLYKEIYDSQKEFDLAGVAYIENDLSQKDKINFEDYLKRNPSREEEFSLFLKTRLNPDEKIKIRQKNRLHKTPLFIKRIYTIARIAAILFLFFSLAILLNQHSEINVPESQIVEVKKENITTKDNETKIDAPQEKKIIKKQENKKIIPAVNDTIKAKEHKSIREKTRGRVEGSDFAAIVRDTLIFHELALLPAEINYSSAELALSGIEIFSQNELIAEATRVEENLIGEKLKTKTGIDKLSLNKIAKAGLGLVSNISKNKFSYDTNNEGDITELNLDTRLLAFTIPTNKEEE